MRKITAYILGEDYNGTECETCFTVSVADSISNDTIQYLIRRAAPIMAKLQGLTGIETQVETIEDENGNPII
jgi:hypothetical protein